MSESVDQLEQVLEVVTDLPETVDLKDGKQVTIYKCKVQHLGTVLKFLTYILEEMQIDGQIGISGANLANPGVALQLFAKASDQLIQVMSVLCSLDEDEIQSLELDDAVDIAVAIWNLNENFFSRQVLPKLPFLQEVPQVAPPEAIESKAQETKPKPPQESQEVEQKVSKRVRRTQ